MFTIDDPALIYRDEPPLLCPLLVDSTVEPEAVMLTWRLMRHQDFEVVLLLEDEGGGLYDERNLGTAREELFDLVPAECRRDLKVMIDELWDAQDFYDACRAEQLRSY